MGWNCLFSHLDRLFCLWGSLMFSAIMVLCCFCSAKERKLMIVVAVVGGVVVLHAGF